MNKKELIQKIIKKKGLSQLPKMDVEMAFDNFDKKQISDIEKVKLTRASLHKIYGAFTSHKLLTIKNKPEEWILRKHLSTRERLPIYDEVYHRILKNYEKVSVIDLGAGVNGFSYPYFKKLGLDVNYVGVEAVGQLADLANHYFKKEKIKGKVYHESLFNLGKIKEIIRKAKRPRIIFLFKTVDSLEMLKRDYSKKLISEIMPLVDQAVISFATESMIKRKRFKIKRMWITDFVKTNFIVLDDFELMGERYIVFCKK